MRLATQSTVVFSCPRLASQSLTFVCPAYIHGTSVVGTKAPKKPPSFQLPSVERKLSPTTARMHTCTTYIDTCVSFHHAPNHTSNLLYLATSSSTHPATLQYGGLHASDGCYRHPRRKNQRRRGPGRDPTGGAGALASPRCEPGAGRLAIRGDAEAGRQTGSLVSNELDAPHPRQQHTTIQTWRRGVCFL